MIKRRVISTLKEFAKLEAAGGIVLMGAAVLAVLLANSTVSSAYFSVLKTYLGPLSLEHWVNDALMALFFFVVGMEIKSELVIGALSSRARAMLPMIGALGGMIVPALIYFFFNFGPVDGPTVHPLNGWGIPMATDIAFAVGALTLLGRRIPSALKIFLLALAVVDDLGAILVIAIFYTGSLYWPSLLGAACGVGLIWLLNHLPQFSRLRNLGFRLFVPLGIMVWVFVLKSGVHATIAGVILGFMVPLETSNKHNILDKWVRRLHPWVAFAVMPIFALVNAGVVLGDMSWSTLFMDPVVSGVSYGLLIGKPLGIVGFCWISVKLGVAALPSGVQWRQMTVIGLFAGIGFTMSIFIANLALPEPSLLSLAKLGIIKGSLLAGVLGAALGIWATPSPHQRTNHPQK